MTKCVAEKHGYRATFMPKPIEGLTGNGCHAHISVWDAPVCSQNQRLRRGRTGQTGEAWPIRTRQALPWRHHETRRRLAAITNPTVNSYKRINAPRTTSGATWAPNTVTWTGNNRTHMVRVPGPGRFELRLPDGAVNPYLLASDHHRSRSIRCPFQGRPGKAPRHRHVRRRPHYH